MKRKDYLIVAIAPLVVLLIPLIGNFVSEEWNWSASDFLIMGLLLAGTTFVWRLLITRSGANLAYRLGAGLGVGTGLLLVWVTLAVAIIGDDNPANLLYPGIILLGLIGVGFAQFQARRLARTAFAVAAATFLVPIIGWLADPADFSPGAPQVFAFNAAFVVLFVGAGLLFRSAATKTP